jgi:thiol-disulfide isomerase/thioredoxin
MTTLRCPALPSVSLVLLAACVPGFGADAAASASASPGAAVPASATSADVTAPDPVRLNKARILAGVLKIDAEVHEEVMASFDASLDTARTQIQNMPPKVQQAFADALDEVRQSMATKIPWQGIDDDVIYAYSRAYSADELDQLTAFYRSALGQREITERSGLAQALVTASGRHTDALMADFQDLIDKRMQAALDAAKDELRAQVGIVVGKAFPAITGTTIDGKPFNLSAWKGKVVLVDFWATWCKPCVRTMPGVIAAYGKYHASGFEVVGISLDQDLDDLTGFIKENQMPWPEICDGQGWDTPNAAKLAIHGIPAPFLIAQDGTLIAADLDGQDLDDAIAKALANGKPAAGTTPP